jgi:emp24/gp25L/p24 family/GOLD
MAPVMSRLKPITQTIKTKTGQIEHTFEVDGTAIICLTTHPANIVAADLKASHLRLAIHVERKEIADLLLQLENDNTTVIVNMDEKKTAKHLSRMEMELHRIQLSLKTILKEADFAKERDALAHKQVMSVHSASMFWPIVQVCVLIMTGFTQASHIVHFFKTRRII